MERRIYRYSDTSRDVELSCDAVVIGSGAGGACVAAELAEGGLDVVVLEEGPFYDTADYGADVTDMLSRAMRDAGTTIMLGRSPVSYLEGRCVGGTTVINGGMCWRTPPEVLDRWISEYGLAELSPAHLEPLFQRVERRMNAREQDPGSEGGNSLVFKDGCDRMGFRTVRNIRNQVHCVGTNDCVTGCPTGAKQSTLFSYLPHLFRNGGAVYAQCRADRILTRKGQATGVRARLQNPESGRYDRALTVQARMVVLACGATQTPYLLLRNRLANSSRQVGRNLTIHPNIKFGAIFDFDVDSIHGAHQAFQCREFQDDGILLAPGGVSPPILTMMFGGFGAEHARQMRDFRKIATGGILVDDHASGRVTVGPFGIPLVRYDVTDQDQAKFIRGAALLARLYFAAGARKILTPFRGVRPLESPDDIRRLEDNPPSVRDTEYFTAHLMGTCRMDSDPRRGVVSPTGETHDVRNLFIADASILPTPIGVNPQETIMALATHIAGAILQDLGRYAGRRAA